MPAISESAGWGPASWWPRSNFAGCKDTNRFPSFSENWKRWFLPRRRLSNAGRRRRVSYARAATFNGKSGDPSLIGESCDHQPRVFVDEDKFAPGAIHGAENI